MKALPDHTRFILFFAGSLVSLFASAQYKVKGTVYDESKTFPIQAVSVMSTNGRGTITDSLGRYQLDVSLLDSIWFSYQGKPTPKYPVQKIADITQFDIAIKLKMDILEEVRVRTRNYKEDSAQNRKDYAKLFNYQKVTVGSMTSIGPMGAGIDVDELIHAFQFKKNRARLKIQQRLIEQEREKSVDHRFNKPLVRKLTGLDGEELDKFMVRYRPTYEFISFASEYDFQLYIKRAFEAYSSEKQKTF